MNPVLIMCGVFLILLGTFVDFDPRNNQKVWIGVDPGGIVRTINRGDEPIKHDIGGNPYPSNWKWERTTLKDGLERMKQEVKGG